MITIFILGVVWIAIGALSLTFYIFNYVVPVSREDEFQLDMIIVMLIALFIPPLYWLLRFLVRGLLK